MVWLTALVALGTMTASGLVGAASGDTIPGGVVAGVSYGQPPAAGNTGVSSCRWRLADPYDSHLGHGGNVSRLIDGRRYWLYERRCDDRDDLMWIPEVTPGQLATHAASEVQRLVSTPVFHSAPPAHRGVVHVPMWFWTTPQSWTPVEATAWVPTEDGVLWATARAVPTALRLESGDGVTAAVTCAGPGVPWQPTDGDHSTRPCSVTYRQASTGREFGGASSRFPVTFSIVWSTSWRSSSGDGGALSPLVSSTVALVDIHEIHALVTA